MRQPHAVARGSSALKLGARPTQARGDGPSTFQPARALGGRLPAAVAVEHHVVGQQLLQPFEIALLRGRDEAGRELLRLLARGLEAGAPPLLHVAAGPCGELPGVLLARADDLRRWQTPTGEARRTPPRSSLSRVPARSPAASSHSAAASRARAWPSRSRLPSP